MLETFHLGQDAFLEGIQKPRSGLEKVQARKPFRGLRPSVSYPVSDTEIVRKGHERIAEVDPDILGHGRGRDPVSGKEGAHQAHQGYQGIDAAHHVGDHRCHQLQPDA